MELIDEMIWDPAMEEELGIKMSQLSALEPSGKPIGTLTKQAAEALGLSENTLVINGGHDQYCGSVGANAFNEGDIMLATGTAWVVLASFTRVIYDLKGKMAPMLFPFFLYSKWK
jgi:sugar (pentulose or hexulose) kinase